MKHVLSILSTLALTSTATAATCEETLWASIHNDENIKVAQTLNSYQCGQYACAVSYEFNNQPYPNKVMLGFLDMAKRIQVNRVIFEEKRTGHQTIKQDLNSYVDVIGINGGSLSLKASIETPRDSILWPPRHVFFQASYACEVH